MQRVTLCSHTHCVCSNLKKRCCSLIMKPQFRETKHWKAMNIKGPLKRLGLGRRGLRVDDKHVIRTHPSRAKTRTTDCESETASARRTDSYLWRSTGRNYSPFLSLSMLIPPRFTSGTGFGTRGPALQGPLVRLLLDHVVGVDGHRVLVDDVLVHQSRARVVVLGYYLRKNNAGRKKALQRHRGVLAAATRRVLKGGPLRLQRCAKSKRRG